MAKVVEQRMGMKWFIVGLVVMATSTPTLAQTTGILSTGDLSLGPQDTLQFELLGLSPGSEYDQISVSGTVDLGSAMLDLIVGFDVSINDFFILIDNDGGDAVTGTFSGLAEGAIVEDVYDQFLYGFSISYLDGDGNDVSLQLSSIDPVPEPFTALLLVSGLAMPGRWRRRILS